MPKFVIGRWLFLLPLVAGLLWMGTGSSQAAGQSWSITDVKTVGCDSLDWQLDVHRAGLDIGYYTWRTQVISDAKVYMNEGFTRSTSNGDDLWLLYSDFSYGTVDSPGAYPIVPGKPMKVLLTVERPVGTVLSSWTMVAKSCDSAELLYNGPTAADLDEDYVATPTDACPSLKAFTANGCPVRDRTLVLTARYGPKRVVGKLYAPGYPALYAGRRVTIWKVRSGPDLKLRTLTTNSIGKFVSRAKKGRYYATSAGLVVPTVGQTFPSRSAVVRVR